MTQIQHITEKEMLRRTGVNALGYTYPEKDLILLKKGLTGKKKREVLDHEVNHLRKGEEGPFVDALIGGGVAGLGSVIGGGKAKDATQAAIDAAYRQYTQGRADLAPYREFGYEQLEDLTNWLGTPGGTYRPSPEEISTLPGYQARLNALENSAIARGGLLSGNTMMDVGEFGASEYDREIARRGGELSRRLGLVNLGYGAAGGTAAMGQDYGRTAAQLAMEGGRGQQAMWNQLGGIGAGVAGSIAGQKNWNAFLDRMYPNA